jgi:hypothetical protein
MNHDRDQSFGFDRKARSFRLTHLGFTVAGPWFVIVLFVFIAILIGACYASFWLLSLLPPNARGTVAGFVTGFLLGVSVRYRKRLPTYPAPPLSARVKQLALDPSQYFEAVKAYREETGTDLARAKQAVDQYLQNPQA